LRGARLRRRSTTRAGIAAAVASLAGCTDDAPTSIQVSDSGYGAYEVSLTRFGDGLAAAWYDTRDGNAEIYLQLLDAGGHPEGTVHRLTNDPAQSYEASIDAMTGAIAVAWYEKDDEARLLAWLGLWSQDAGFTWRRRLGRDGSGSRNPVARVFAERIFCAWIEREPTGDENVYGAWWDAAGNELAPPAELGPAGSTTWNLNVAIDSAGVAYVVFDAALESSAEELFLAALSDGGVVRRQLTANDGHRSKYPDLALSGDRAALTWFDERDGNREVYLHVGDIDSLRELDADDASAGRDLATRSSRVSFSAGPSIGAYAAWNGERVGLAWTDSEADGQQIFYQSFTPDGEPRTPAEQLTSSGSSSLIPAITPWASGFAIAWNEVDAGSGSAHYGSRSEIHLIRLR